MKELSQAILHQLKLLFQAVNMAQKTEVNYVPEKTSFLVNSMFSAGAISIDGEGIVEVTCRE